MAAKQLVPVTAAAYVSISASTFANYVEIQEDGSGNSQGLKVKYPSDNFTQVYIYAPSDQPIKIGIPNNTGAPGGAPLAGKPVRTVALPNAAGGYTNRTEPATVYCQVESLGPADTVVRVDERP